MTPAPPPIPAPRNLFRDFAKVSWIGPLVALVVSFALMAAQAGQGGQNPISPWFHFSLSILLIGGGLIAGIVALCGIPRHGTAGILVPAFIGIVINASLIILAAAPVILGKRHRAHLQPLTHAANARTITNERLKFSVDIPRDFKEFPEGKRTPATEHVFIKGDPLGRDMLTVINIENLGGIIRKDSSLGPTKLPQGFTGQLTKSNWRGVEVDTMVSIARQERGAMLIHTIQVPLIPIAIQVSVGGPEGKASEITNLVTAVLASLDGETNW